jgi:hypothetical protein
LCGEGGLLLQLLHILKPTTEKKIIREALKGIASTSNMELSSRRSIWMEIAVVVLQQSLEKRRCNEQHLNFAMVRKFRSAASYI